MAIEGQFAPALDADIIVPSQYFDQIRSEISAQPEKRLMLAVMENAIAAFQHSIPGATRRQRRLLKETEEWVYSDDTSWLCSFENICALLGIDADYLRNGLAEWKKTQLTHDEAPGGPAARFPLRRMSGRRYVLSPYTSSLSA
jgi:hypothetical protein